MTVIIYFSYDYSYIFINERYNFKSKSNTEYQPINEYQQAPPTGNWKCKQSKKNEELKYF